MKIRVLISKVDMDDEKFSFIVDDHDLGDFFDNFFDYFENYQNVVVRFFPYNEVFIDG